MDSNKTIDFKELIYKIIDNKIIILHINNEIFENISDENFNKFLNALKLNKSLKTLKFKDASLSQENFEKLCDVIRYNKNITNLYITRKSQIFNCVNSKYSNIINFYNSLTKLNNESIKCKELYKFKSYINFMYNNLLEDILNNNMSSVFNMLINNKFLTKITLDIDNFKLFSKVLCKNNSINYLNLRIALDNDYNNYNYIVDVLNNNKNIKAISILLCVKNMTFYNDFLNFCKIIETNQTLKKIKIGCVKKGYNITDKNNDIPILFFNSLIKNKTINYIKFNHCGIISDDIVFDYNIFINLLENNNVIETLYLNWYEKDNKSINFNKFLEYLQFNKTLKRLQLSYVNEEINTKLLALIIKNNKTLEYLNVSKFNVSNLDLFFEYLKENTTLKCLDLSNVKIPFIKENINEVLQFNKNIEIIY